MKTILQQGASKRRVSDIHPVLGYGLWSTPGLGLLTWVTLARACFLFYKAELGTAPSLGLHRGFNMVIQINWLAQVCIKLPLGERGSSGLRCQRAWHREPEPKKPSIFRERLRSCPQTQGTVRKWSILLGLRCLSVESSCYTRIIPMSLAKN